MKHAPIYLLDMDIRAAWFPKSKLQDAQWIHAEWNLLNEWNTAQFQLSEE
jgi:hypothetical protein